MQCLQLIVLRFFDGTDLMPRNPTILVLDPQHKRTCIHISFPWAFILADLLKPAFRHTAENVEPPSRATVSHLRAALPHSETLVGRTGILCVIAGLSSSPGQGFV